MNLADEARNTQGFAYRDLLGFDKWETFTPTFTSLTVVGTPTYTGRLHVIGSQCFFQITLVATTSIASTAGTTYFALPISSQGLGGQAQMDNLTTFVTVGGCVIDATNGRCYVPSQGASGNTFSVAGWYEV